MTATRTLALAALCALCALALHASAQDLNPGVSYELSANGYTVNSCRSHFLSPATLTKPVSGAEYLPKQVNWKGFMNAIDCLGKREHRVCTFLIRMFFHDAGAVDLSKSPNQGADGSVVINDVETILPQSTQHGEAPMDRYVLNKLAEKYGMSYADGLSIAAAQCTLTLRKDDEYKLNILTWASKKGTPVYVGKYDNINVDLASVKDPLPGGVDPADKWLKFWRVYLNEKIRNDKWKFTTREAVAMMGSHILVDNHKCSRSSSGYLRTHHWDNGYFKDVNSGRVLIKPSDSSPGYKILLDGFTRQPVPDDGSFCDFDTSGFRRKTHNSEHESKAQQIARGIFLDDSSFNPQQLDVFWSPDGARAMCFGDDLCVPCSSDSDSRDFCKNGGSSSHLAGDAFWPYTINDGFLVYAAKNPGNDYCATAYNGCNFGGDWSYPGRDDDMYEVQRAFDVFRKKEKSWFQNYASGHAKLSNMNAYYGKKGRGVDITTLVGSYEGTCDYDRNSLNKALVDDILSDPPCDVPDPKDLPGASPPGEKDCFPADALVMTPSGEPKRMQDVVVGDYVAVVKADGSVAFEMVYAQGHADAAAVSNFVRLSLSPVSGAGASKTLELTARHFIPVKQADSRINTRAEDVSVGDLVWALRADVDVAVARTELYTVTDKTTVEKAGLYNPYTTSGSILVNSVEASCHSNWIADGLFDAFGAPHLLPAFYQALFTPLRMFLAAVGRSVYLGVRIHELVMAVVTSMDPLTLAATAALPIVAKVALVYRAKRV